VWVRRDRLRESPRHRRIGPLVAALWAAGLLLGDFVTVRARSITPQTV